MYLFRKEICILYYVPLSTYLKSHQKVIEQIPRLGATIKIITKITFIWPEKKTDSVGVTYQKED